MPRTPVCSFHKCAAIAALLCVALSASAQVRNRITQRIEDTEPAVVVGAHPLARPEFDRGRVDGSMRIRRAAMVFQLAPAQQSALKQLLAEQQDPSSPNYQKWLTPEQYAARFGMSDGDLGKVAAWLKSQGLTVNGFSRGRTRVFFSGTAGRVETAFRTELHQFEVDGETRFANATEISVPAALSGMVLGFRGLDNFRPRPRARAVKPNFTSHVTGNHFVTPGDFATIYNLAPLYSAGFDGTGQKIAVVGQTQIHTADIDAFRSAAGLPAKNLQLINVDGSGFSNGDEVEADLDVEWSGGVAKNAGILYVFTGSNSSQNVFDAFAFAIDNNLAPVISTSYGNCEANLTSGNFIQALQQDVQQANSQGQTVTAASGDSGAADCDLASATSATHGLAVDAPASIPEVTGIGGSEFTGDTAGTVTGSDAGADAPFWGGTTGGNDNISSALAYIPEMAWNDTTASIAAGFGLSASGGGVSKVFAKPSWQTALTPNDAHRDVPDVSLTGSPNHDGSLVCSQAATGASATRCTNGFRDSTGNVSPVGGTSVGAPAFAGIVAILNQARQSGGSGNINPTIYTLAVSTPAAFHDISTGNNVVPCTAGSTGCPASHTIGLSAGTGYDLVTGLGTIDAQALITAWPGFVGTPNFSIGGTPINVLAPGQTGTSTITVTATNGFSGAVNLSCSGLPTGASCAFVPAAVTSTGTSTLTITTTSATPVATSNITVTGTSGSTVHSTSVSLTVNAPTAPDFNISAAPSSAAITAGASATSTITVTPVGGFSGAVNLTCAVTGGGTPAPTCSLSTASLANGSGTPTLTVKTTAPHSLSGALTPTPGRHGFGWLAASGTLLVGVLAFGVPSPRRRRIAGLGLMLLVFFAAGMGCGGGSSSSGGSAQTGGGTPAGTYVITVTATSTSPALSHLTLVTITIP